MPTRRSAFEILTHYFLDSELTLVAKVYDLQLAREYRVELTADTASMTHAYDVGDDGEAHLTDLHELGDTEKLEIERWASRSNALREAFCDGMADEHEQRMYEAAL